MTPFFIARLVNGLFGDPCVFVDLRSGSRAVLLDLGDVAALGAHELNRVTHVCVSHTHMDHFAGFDRLLRTRLVGASSVQFCGPDGFIARVDARLRSYTWNLLGATSPDFSLDVSEITDEGMSRRAVFRARSKFVRQDADVMRPGSDAVAIEPDFTIHATVLDHGTPSLAYALQEGAQTHVDPLVLDRLGFAPGPWINDAKRALREGAPASTLIQVGQGQMASLGLVQEAFRTCAGQKIAYVVDSADHVANQARIVRLAVDADELFIEAAFSDEDHAQAAARRHLTAGTAGRLAREARARAVVPLHLSARYAGRADLILAQVDAAFAQTRTDRAEVARDPVPI